MAKNQTAGKSNKPKIPAVLTAPTMAPRPARQVAAGTVEGPKGKKLVDAAGTTPVEVPVEQREGERRQQQADAVMQFTAGPMTTPAAHAPALTAEQQRRAEFDAKVAELAKEMGVEAPQLIPAKQRAAKQQVNGITRPAEGTETGKVWATADAISASQAGHPAQIAQMKAHPNMKGMNDHTLKTQYSRWRQYNGVKGRLQTIKPVQAEGTYEGVPILK